MGRVQGSSLGAGRAHGSYLMEDQLPRPLSMVRRLVEGLGGHQQKWSIMSNLALSDKRTDWKKSSSTPVTFREGQGIVKERAGKAGSRARSKADKALRLRR